MSNDKLYSETGENNRYLTFEIDNSMSGSSSYMVYSTSYWSEHLSTYNNGLRNARYWWEDNQTEQFEYYYSRFLDFDQQPNYSAGTHTRNPHMFFTQFENLAEYNWFDDRIIIIITGI